MDEFEDGKIHLVSYSEGQKIYVYDGIETGYISNVTTKLNDFYYKSMIL